MFNSNNNSVNFYNKSENFNISITETRNVSIPLTTKIIFIKSPSTIFLGKKYIDWLIKNK